MQTLTAWSNACLRVQLGIPPLTRLCFLVPVWPHHPDPSKNTLITSKANFDRANAVLSPSGFKIKAGSRFHGSYVGGREQELGYVMDKISKWTLTLDELIGTTK